MKNIKSIFLLNIVCLNVTQSYELPWYLAAIQKTPFSYQNKCILINLVQYYKQLSTFTSNIINRQTIDDIKKDIAQRHSAIKNIYHQKEALCLDNLKTAFNITNDEWNRCLNIINSTKKLLFDQLRAPNPQTMYDNSAIPHNIMSLITPLLQHNNIHPQTISFIYKKKQKKKTFALAKISLSYTHNSINECFIDDPRLNPSITIFSNIEHLDVIEQQALCAHEIEHIHQGHSITMIVLAQYLQHYKNQNQKNIENNEAFKQLKIIYEAQAEIFAALKTPEIAQAFVNLRSKKYYPGNLYEAHYHDLVEINNLWKIEKFLMKFQNS